MLISTLIPTVNDLPGDTTTVPGERFGLTVRSPHVGSPFGTARMVAGAHGGNAVLAVRSHTSETDGHWTEICAGGTAVVTEPVG
jgi:hypothetical protein